LHGPANDDEAGKHPAAAVPQCSDTGTNMTTTFPTSSKAENIIHLPVSSSAPISSAAANLRSNDAGTPTALVYCEGNFGFPDGKTANGLVRPSQKY